MKNLLIIILLMVSCASVGRVQSEVRNVVSRNESVVIVRNTMLRMECDAAKNCKMIEEHGLGTGFVFKKGYIMTNAHVVAKSVLTMVKTKGGKESYTTVVFFDPIHDIAILKYHDDLGDIEPLEFSEEYQIGDPIVVIGHPLRYVFSHTFGRICAERTIRGTLFIQTDAAINFGNSGGVMLNHNGRVVAMTTMMVNPVLNFGVSSKEIVRRIKKWSDEVDYK